MVLFPVTLTFISQILIRSRDHELVLLYLALVLGLELSLRTHLKSLALALKVESLLALILNIFY